MCEFHDIIGSLWQIIGWMVNSRRRSIRRKTTYVEDGIVRPPFAENLAGLVS